MLVRPCIHVNGVAVVADTCDEQHVSFGDIHLANVADAVLIINSYLMKPQPNLEAAAKACVFAALFAGYGQVAIVQLRISDQSC
jgi:hypothetical protein